MAVTPPTAAALVSLLTIKLINIMIDIISNINSNIYNSNNNNNSSNNNNLQVIT